MEVPLHLRRRWSGDDVWLRDLPAIVEACATDWGLQLEAPLSSAYSLVIAAGDVVLKLTAPSDHESEAEADALATWRGDGAVRLLARNDERRAILIERCWPGTHLWNASTGHIEIACDLMSRLTLPLPADHPFQSLRDAAARWEEEVKHRYEEFGQPFERSLLDYAVGVFRSANPDAMFLANQDLHGGNILQAGREPWLAIDPKPIAGERELSAVGMLRNAAMGTGFSHAAIRLWFDALANIGLDRHRVREWGVAHAIGWGHDDAGWYEWSIEVARTIRAA
jgi:streptomycin 6-kinase